MTPTLATALQGRCACGRCSLQVQPGPAARFVCHCTICQAYTGRPFSDILLVRRHGVQVQGLDALAFRRLRPPPNIERGRCRHCDTPALEFGGLGPAQLAFVPVPMLQAPAALPPVALEIFCHRRVQPAAAGDTAPRRSGYWASELAFARLAFGLFR